jgi:hypothetical protein
VWTFWKTVINLYTPIDTGYLLYTPIDTVYLLYTPVDTGYLLYTPIDTGYLLYTPIDTGYLFINLYNVLQYSCDSYVTQRHYTSIPDHLPVRCKAPWFFSVKLPSVILFSSGVGLVSPELRG